MSLLLLIRPHESAHDPGSPPSGSAYETFVRDGAINDLRVSDGQRYSTGVADGALYVTTVSDSNPGV